ncbi:MAG: hypothetical protein ACE5KU_03950 [Nitrososphaerales archaeon]
MLDEAKVRRKLRLAEETVKRCIGRNGFYAGTQLYQKQYWIRDLAYSLEPLLDSGFSDVVKRHLEYTLHRQKMSGEIPERIIQMPPSISGIILLAKTLLRRNPSLLIRYIPTYDSDLLMLISIHRYVEQTQTVGFKERYAEQIKSIWRHLDTLLIDGLLPEADWRDAMLNYVSKKTFCNQVLLITANRLAGRRSEVQEGKRLVNSVFWDENLGYYQDYPGSTRFDTLGHSLAILEDIVPKKRFEGVIQALQESSTRFGFRNIRPSYPERECGQAPEYYQNSTVWPFIQGYAIASLVKVGLYDIAEEEFRKFTDLPGFNEWYNPSTGLPRGSEGQLWSAAAYIRAYKSLINL